MTLPLGFRAVVGLAKLLERAHLMPGNEALAKQPVEKRKAQKPPKLLLRKPPAGVSTEERVVDGVAVRMYRTARPSGKALVYIHGGGFVMGGFNACDHILRDLAHLTNDLIVSVDYRLAPEDPFPAGLDDCDTVLQWVIANADALGVDGDDVAVGGDSAGGNLTAALCLRHRIDNVRISRQVLIYPALDLTCARDSWTTEANSTGERDRAFGVFGHYSATTDRTDPLISPLFAPSLEGLPPALVMTSEHDTLRDDGRDYAEALRQAGVAVRYSEYARMPHAFLSLQRLASCYDHALLEIANFLA